MESIYCVLILLFKIHNIRTRCYKDELYPSLRVPQSRSPVVLSIRSANKPRPSFQDLGSRVDSKTHLLSSGS